MSYRKIKKLYLSENYTKKKLSDIYKVNPSSMGRLLMKVGVKLYGLFK